jgi:predicted dehydrogenase
MRKTRWGILGTGSIAALFAEDLGRLPGAELAAIGSRSQATATAFARSFGARRAHGSYRALAADPEVDVIYVATPNSLHMEHCLLALEHGKPILCEKPFALSASEARTVIELARRKRLFCMEGMWMRFVPLMREVIRRVREGEIGEVRMVDASLGFSTRFDATHRLYDPRLGGGALLDLGVYPLSLVRQLLGRQSALSAYASWAESGVDDQTSVLLEFASGAQATITASLRCRMPNEATIVGTRGIVRIHAPLYCPESATFVHSDAPSAHVDVPKRRRPLLRLRQHPLVRELRERVKQVRDRRVLTMRRIGNGYAHEALEVMRCLALGECESASMTLHETLDMMQTLDDVRGSNVRAEREGGTNADRDRRLRIRS